MFFTSSLSIGCAKHGENFLSLPLPPFLSSFSRNLNLYFKWISKGLEGWKQKGTSHLQDLDNLGGRKEDNMEFVYYVGGTGFTSTALPRGSSLLLSISRTRSSVRFSLATSFIYLWFQVQVMKTPTLNTPKHRTNVIPPYPLMPLPVSEEKQSSLKTGILDIVL